MVWWYYGDGLVFKRLDTECPLEDLKCEGLFLVSLVLDGKCIKPHPHTSLLTIVNIFGKAEMTRSLLSNRALSRLSANILVEPY